MSRNQEREITKRKIPRRSMTPKIKTAIAVAFDLLTYLWLCSAGAVLTLDCVHKRMGAGFVFLAATQVALIVAITFRNSMQRRLTVAQKELLKKYEEEHRKLKDVALAAVALTINIEHGLHPTDSGPIRGDPAFPPRIDVLKRYLAALAPDEEQEAREACAQAGGESKK